MKTRIPIIFTGPQDEWLREEAARTGLSIADILRRILDAYRNEHPHPRRQDDESKP